MTTSKGSLTREKAASTLGSEWDEARNKAYAYVFGVLRKGWFDPARVKANEGGINTMVDTALCYIVEAEDIGRGLKEYGKYLGSEYANNVSHNRWSPVEDALDLPTFADAQDIMVPRQSTISGEAEEPGSERPVALTPEGICLLKNNGVTTTIPVTPRQREILECYMSCGSWAEVERLLGITNATRRTHVRRLRAAVADVTPIVFNICDAMETPSAQPG